MPERFEIFLKLHGIELLADPRFEGNHSSRTENGDVADNPRFDLGPHGTEMEERQDAHGGSRESEHEKMLNAGRFDEVTGRGIPPGGPAVAGGI